MSTQGTDTVDNTYPAADHVSDIKVGLGLGSQILYWDKLGN